MSGVVEKHARWAAGKENNHPEKGCCVCGRWKLKLPKVSSSRATAASPSEEVPCWSTKSFSVPWGNAPFCPAWPRYEQDNSSALTAGQRELLRAAVRRAVGTFATSGVSRERCMSTPS